jgi:predicted nuclease of predicted toxin-antitoxin system
VRFLIDAQLPPKLAQWLNDRNADAIHVSDIVNGLFLPDIKLWNIARSEDRIIVTKDMDFFELSAVYGAPPRVIILRFGNCSNNMMLMNLSSAWTNLVNYLNDPHVRLILLNMESMEIYHP